MTWRRRPRRGWHEFPREDTWKVVEIEGADWDDAALRDPTPLLVCSFARQGPRRGASERQLQELELMVDTVWATGMAPLRVARVDVSVERDLEEALRLHHSPALLFIRNAKLVFRTSRFATAEELAQLVGCHLYNAPRTDAVKAFDADIGSPSH